MTYGALVVQLIQDYEDYAEVNKQLDKMGFNIGTRLIEDFLARSNLGRCADFKETGEAIAKASVPSLLFLSLPLDVFVVHRSASSPFSTSPPPSHTRNRRPPRHGRAPPRVGKDRSNSSNRPPRRRGPSRISHSRWTRIRLRNSSSSRRRRLRVGSGSATFFVAFCAVRSRWCVARRNSPHSFY